MSRRFDQATINLALAVLREVLPRCPDHDVGTPAVRLALRVLHPHAPDATLDFWRHAGLPNHPWESGHTPYKTMVRRLTAAGWEVDPENVL